MATRSIIKVQGFESALYKHWDGYPSSTLPWLIEFFGTFYAKRGFDESYCLAQLVRFTVRLAEKHNLSNDNETGYGIVASDADCGAQYTYELCENGSIAVNGIVVWRQGDKPLTKTKLEALE